MKQVRKSTVTLTIESSKTKPFKVTYKSNCNNDKFMVIHGKDRTMDEILEKVEQVIETYLDSEFTESLR